MVASWTGNAECVEILLAYGADSKFKAVQDFEGVPAGSTPLSVATAAGHSDVVALLTGRPLETSPNTQGGTTVTGKTDASNTTTGIPSQNSAISTGKYDMRMLIKLEKVKMTTLI